MPEPTIIVATLLHGEGETGVQSHFGTFLRYLKEQGHACDLCTPFASSRWLVYPVFAMRRLIDPIWDAASVWWYRHWHEWFLRRALRKRLVGVDRAVIYTQCPLSARAALAARASPNQRVVLVVHFNQSQADEWAGKGKLRTGGYYYRAIRGLEAKIIESLDAIVYVSNYMKRQLEARIPGVCGVANAVIPNFCNLQIDAPIDAAPQFDVINVGTLEPRKNQQFLLQVVAVAKRRGKRVRLLLVGDGPSRASLQTLARQLEVQDLVTFAGYQRNAAALMKGARIYAHAALIENFPLTLVEALSCGLPILAPSVGGIPELFVHGEQGWLWSTDDVEKAAGDLVNLLDDAELHKRLSVSARERYENCFETAQIARRLRQFLLDIADRDSGNSVSSTMAPLLQRG